MPQAHKCCAKMHYFLNTQYLFLQAQKKSDSFKALLRSWVVLEATPDAISCKRESLHRRSLLLGQRPDCINRVLYKHLQCTTTPFFHTKQPLCFCFRTLSLVISVMIWVWWRGGAIFVRKNRNMKFVHLINFYYALTWPGLAWITCKMSPN